MPTTDVVEYVAVENEPMHLEQWRSPTIRVLRADFPASSSCLWHEHVRYTVYICITELDVMEHKLGQQPVPLRLQRGFVLVRDHETHPLIHTAYTKEEDVMLVGVELYRPLRRSHEQQTPIIDIGDCVHHDSSCEVHRIVIDPSASLLSFSCTIPSESVLVALDHCQVEIQGSPSTTMHLGSAIPVANGSHTITVQTSGEASCTLYLIAIFSDR